MWFKRMTLEVWFDDYQYEVESVVVNKMLRPATKFGRSTSPKGVPTLEY